MKTFMDDESNDKDRAEEIIAQIKSHKLRKILEEDQSDDFFSGLELGLEKGREAVRALMKLYDDRHIP